VRVVVAVVAVVAVVEEVEEVVVVLPPSRELLFAARVRGSCDMP